MKLQPSHFGSVTAAIPRLSTGFPGLVQLKLSDVSLRFTHLQALGQLRCLQHLQLHNVECNRETFSWQRPGSPQHSVFAHLVQLTQLELYHTPSVPTMKVKKTRYLTEDLHGLSHLSKLQSLTVQTRPSRPQWTSRCHAFRRIETPVVPAHKLVTLSYLTALHVNVMPPLLVTLTQLQVLDLAQLSLQRLKLPANMAALKRLSQLAISGRTLPPSELTPLSTLPALKWLAVNRVPDDLLGPIEAFTALKRLDLIGLDIHHQTSACLARMTHLTSLHLGVNGGSIFPNSSQLVALQNLLPTLTHLSNLELHFYRTCLVFYDKRPLENAHEFLEWENYVVLQQLLPHTKLFTMGMSFEVR